MSYSILKIDLLQTSPLWRLQWSRGRRSSAKFSKATSGKFSVAGDNAHSSAFSGAAAARVQWQNVCWLPISKINWAMSESGAQTPGRYKKILEVLVRTSSPYSYCREGWQLCWAVLCRADRWSLSWNRTASQLGSRVFERTKRYFPTYSEKMDLAWS